MDGPDAQGMASVKHATSRNFAASVVREIRCTVEAHPLRAGW